MRHLGPTIIFSLFMKFGCPSKERGEVPTPVDLTLEKVGNNFIKYDTHVDRP